MTHRPKSRSFDSLLREAVVRRHEEMTRLVPGADKGVPEPDSPVIFRPNRARKVMWRVAAAVTALVAVAASVLLIRPGDEAPVAEPTIIAASTLSIPEPVEGGAVARASNQRAAQSTLRTQSTRRIRRAQSTPRAAAQEQPLQNVTVPEGWQPVDPRRQVAEILTASLAMADKLSAPISTTNRSLYDE